MANKYDLKENINIEEIDKLFKQAIETIEKYKETLDSVTKVTKESGKANDEILKSQKEKKKVLTDIEKIEKENEKIIKKIIIAETEQNKELQRSKIALNEKNKAIRDAIKEENSRINSLEKAEKALNKEVKSIVDAQKQNKALREAVKNLDATTLEGAKTIERYNKIIDENTDFMKENSDKRIQNTMTIGDYKNQVKEALAETNLFSGSMGTFSEILSPFTDVFKSMGEQIKFTSKGFKEGATTSQMFTSSMKILNLILAANVLGILILGLASVVTYFKATSDGAKEFDKWMKVINGTIDIAISKIATLGRGLKEWVFGSKDLSEAWGDVTEEFSKTSDQFQKVIDTAEDINSLEYEVKELERTTASLNAELDKSIAKYQSIADDSTVSLKEQEEAQRTALSLEIQKSNSILELARKELEAKEAVLEVQREIDDSTTSYKDALIGVEEATIRLREAETEAYNTQYRASQNLRQIRQDEGEQRLDYLIDFFDNQKTINERIISDDKRTLSERQSILDETTRLSDKTFSEQIELLQSFAKERIDTNKLINESDSFTAYEYAKSLGLSEVLTNRLLEVTRERKTITQDLIEVQNELTEAQIKSNEEAEKQSNENQARILEERLDLVKKNFNDQHNALVNQLSNSEISYEEYNSRLEDLTKERISSESERIVNFYDEQLNALEGFHELSLEQQEEYLEAKEELNNFEVELEKNKFDEFTALASNYGQIATNIGNIILGSKKAQIDKELDYLNEKSNTEEGLTKDEEIRQRELAIKKAQIVRKEAVLDKTSSLISIAINTARAVAQSLPNIPLSISVGLLGATQAGLVLAQPLPQIPQFEKGTNKAPSGLKIMGEKGVEALESQSGELLGFTASKPTLYNDLGGYKVLTAKETEKKYSSDKYSKSNNEYLKKIAKKKSVINVNIQKEKVFAKTVR